MNSIRMQLLKRLQAEETWGFVTKEHRLLAGLPKEHIFDAAVGRMATGYAILMDSAGNKVDLKPIPKFEKMKRVNARSSCMMMQRAIPTSLH